MFADSRRFRQAHVVTLRGNWVKLGRLLEDRRIELGYDSREAFAEETGVASSRVLSDLENAKRTNFSRATLLGVEAAYEWKRGSIDSVLSGREPTPIEEDKGIVVQERRTPTVAQLRGEIRKSLGRLTESQLVRVRDFIAGVIDPD